MHHYRSTLRRVQRNPGGGRSSHTLEARLYQRLAFAELSAGQLGKAERHVRKSMKLNAITGEEYGLAINHELLGQVNLRLGEATAAEKELRKSLEIVESLGRYDTRARVLKHLAGARRLRGELDDALSLYGLAIDGLRRYADGFEVAVTELDRGALYHEMDDTDGALRCYHRALQIFGEYRHHIRQGQALRRIAAVHAARGDTETALAQLERALSLIPTESELARSVRHELRRYRKLRYRPPVGVVQRLVGLARRAMGALPGVRGKS
jgi:tetratricopeptide (TPR) repeat protein